MAGWSEEGASVGCFPPIKKCWNPPGRTPGPPVAYTRQPSPRRSENTHVEIPFWQPCLSSSRCFVDETISRNLNQLNSLLLQLAAKQGVTGRGQESRERHLRQAGASLGCMCVCVCVFRVCVQREHMCVPLSQYLSVCCISLCACLMCVCVVSCVCVCVCA